MNTPAIKALRDFWHERTRTLLVVGAIALGIAAFTTVLASYAVLTRALSEGYLGTNPASVTLFTDSVDAVMLATVKANTDVAEAEARRTVRARIRTGPASWRPLTLFVVSNFYDVRVSTMQPETGAWPPATGEILLERDALGVAHAAIGDEVTVKMPAGGEYRLRFSGSVRDVGQAQARMEQAVYGYVTPATLAQLGEPVSLNQLKIVVAKNRFDAAHISRVAQVVKAQIEEQHHPVTRIDIPPPGEHPHAAVMGLLLLAMSAFGLFAVTLSGVLVVNLLIALMAAQIRQIGVMKAIGGSRAQVAQIYLGQAMLLGGAAVILALPVGLLGSRALSRALAALLNFDIPGYAFPLWVFALVAAIGVLAPLLSAAIPVWRASGISVRQALADAGVPVRVFGVSRFDRLLAGVGGAARPLLLALRNSFRRRTRLLMTVATLAFGGVFFMTALNVRDTFMHTLDGLFAGKHFDFSVTLAGMTPIDAIERAAAATPGVRRVEGWIVSEGVAASATVATSVPVTAQPMNTAPSAAGHVAPAGGAAMAMEKDRFTIFALPVDSKFQGFDIPEGRALQAGDLDVMVVNSTLAASNPRMQPGSTVVVQMGPARVAWRIIGVTRELLSPPVAYVPKGFFEAIPGHAGMANTLRLVLEQADAGSIDALRPVLDRNLEREGARAVSALSKSDSRESIDAHLLMLYRFLIVVACIVGAVGGLGLMTTMSLNVMERRREMGVMRAIGASSWVVCLIVVTEGVIIGLMSWLAAALIAWPLGRALGYLMAFSKLKSAINFSFDPLGLAIWLAVALVVGAAASFIPAWHAARSPVREAIS